MVNIQNNIYLGACPHSGPPSGFILPAPLLGILLCGIPGGHCMLPRPMAGAGISFQWDTLPAKCHLLLFLQCHLLLFLQSTSTRLN